jgi:BirA family biotin operon repressor/biotin-[acetyl-CoA-carboxylase] ligase
VSESASRILGALRSAEQSALSGERLSEVLQVSRAQIWKYVEALRKRGYEIEGTPGGGYRLAGSPDRLYTEELLPRLETQWLGRDIHYLDTTDSTNRVAFELARNDAPHGTAVIAEGQTSGRGRLGRSFFSPAYQNLYTSIVLRPELTTADAPTLIPSAAIAVADAVAQSIDDPGAVEIKWPNDVLLGGLKTSGILMEMSAEATRVGFAILGIGVNLNVERESFPDEFRELATSLRSHSGQRVDRIAFTTRLFGILEEVLDSHAGGGFPALKSRYEARFGMRGRRVRVVELDGAEIHGIAEGIGNDGALEITRDDGRRVRVVAGDVTLSRPAPQTSKEDLPS